MNIVLLLGTVVGVLAVVPYIKSIISGQVKPRLVTWAVWALLAAVMTVSALLGGQVVSAILSLQSVIGCSAVIIFGWRRGSLSIARSDIVYLAGAAIGMASLIVLRDPTMALVISIVVDSLAFVPTFIHGWQAPDEENLLSFALGASAGATALFVAVGAGAGWLGLLYPLYSTIFNAAMVGILFASRNYFRDISAWQPAGTQEG